MTNRLRISMVIGVLLLAGALAWWRWHGTATRALPPPPASTAALAKPAIPAAEVNRSLPNPPPPASVDPQVIALQVAAVDEALRSGSLRGSAADGAIELEANGQLKLNMALRRWFDYYLSLVGEVPPLSIRSWIAAELARSQPEAVRLQVLDALDRYMRYLADVDRVASQLDSADAARRLQILKDLRQQHLGAVQAKGFFADEEAYGDFTLARQRLSRDPSLSVQQREAQIDALFKALPDSVRAPVESFRRTEQDMAKIDQINAASSDPNQRFAEREQAFGAEAAARLELLDREAVLWQSRLDAYKAERARVAALRSLSEAERQAALQQFRAQTFDESERLRVEALEEAGALPD